MSIYSYYYGANQQSGTIGVQAQSEGLAHLGMDARLQELSGLHALTGSGNESDMISYLVPCGDHWALGMSYTEAPKSSGYNRSAPCRLIYVASKNDMREMAVRLDKIVNFVNFQKPAAKAPAAKVPAALESIPCADSGYSYRTSSAVLAALVDGLVQAIYQSEQKPMLIGLPKGKANDYATARYTMAEMLSYLPDWMRTEVSFFTGLPVAEGVNDPVTGFDTAVSYGANVIFCPNDYFAQLKNWRGCIAVDMSQPTGTVGDYAKLMTSCTGVSATLEKVECCLDDAFEEARKSKKKNPDEEDEVDYELLNKAAEFVMEGNVESAKVIRKKLTEKTKECEALNKKYESLGQQFTKLKSGYDALAAENKQMEKQLRYAQQDVVYVDEDDDDDEEEGGGRKVLRWILNIICALLLIAVTAFGTIIVKDIIDDKAAQQQPAQVQQQPEAPVDQVDDGAVG